MTNGRNWTRMSRQPPTGTERGQRAAQILDHVNGADSHANREGAYGRLVLHKLEPLSHRNNQAMC